MSIILERVVEHAKKFPDRDAFLTEKKVGKDYIKEVMTWKELDEKSNQIANYLDRKLESKKPVLVIGDKSPNMIALFLGCSKSGRAYVPIDCTAPMGRIRDIADAVNPEMVFVTEEVEEISSVGERLNTEDIFRIFKEESVEFGKETWIKGEDLVYIIFTSGSTGTPKGVQITADCLDHFSRWAVSLEKEAFKEAFSEEKGYRFMNQAPFSFDLSVFDLYMSLYTGGTLCAITKTMQNDKEKLYEFLETSNADVWVSTPSFVEIALADEKFKEDLIPNMKLFLFCGERLTNQTVEKLHVSFPKAQVINTYGPTESTVAMTSILVNKEVLNTYHPLPIGKVKPGTFVYIMDKDGNVLPDGEKGEIVIVGDTVSTGYWNNQEKTKEVFGNMDVDGKTYRLYHTHDKGFYQDGYLFYCGRIDLQIKLHGYRIELEDIESNILMVDNVERTVILPEYAGEEIISLTTYIVPKVWPESRLKERRRIREELKKRIPEYMIPKKFVFKEELPVTSNGKVDRKRLEAMK